MLTDFKSTSYNVLPIFYKHLLSKDALVVGKDIEEFSRPTDPKSIGDLKEGGYFVYSMMLGVGKHSIFYYDPSSDSIYTRMIVVEPVRE